ncbi:hypothetical protein VMCG_03719 [Cytospora schulzeri]|uniref:Uncharacterized protein n=1 Tax=Cytospora schulzeri TaxID=448051 RepID=A0A423WUE7_9PEZI|nr:hypothetical protein VMCG_03719 [Valsa malicola]
MDNPLTRPSAHGFQKPQVFIKVEFGVSWSPQHAPRTHGYEYKSRALRERAPHFPRHVPAPTTNYLAAASIQQFQEAQVPQFHYQAQPEQIQSQQWPTHHEHNSHQAFLQQESQHHRQHRSRQVDFAPEPEFPPSERRSPRDERAASCDRHERGRSAPPPLSDNNWDVVQPRAAHVSAGSSTACATATRPVSNIWKDLPEVPTRFRLGEEGMPWESWSIPVGWEPYFEPDPLLQPPSSQASPHSHHSQLYQEPSAVPERNPTSPMAINDGSPNESSRYRGEDPERVRELEALGSAMMTVDNGFENQWWNQGERQPMPTAMHPPATTHDQVREQLALGWAMAHLPPGAAGDSVSFVSPEQGTATLSNMVVSPVSSYSGPALQPGLSRTMSTRSDELWFTGGSYA